MKYTAINIGPIVSTLSMARKPRELWSASYLFSFLMECIINEIKEKEGKKEGEIEIISPASINGVENLYKEVGLYPDRVFIKSLDEKQAKDVCEAALKTFTDTTQIGKEYVNIMHVSVNSEAEADVIRTLNRLLDCAELVNRPSTDTGREKVLNLIQQKSGSSLYQHASESKEWNIPTLAEIATYLCSKSDKSDMWIEYCKEARKSDGNKGANREDDFYVKLKSEFKNEYHSYFKYICVVQADGDNMGKIVSSLQNKNVKTLSAALLNYGSEVSRLIKGYGGIPIYAGGDDLLFIAPVVSTKENAGKGIGNIFELLAAIDSLYKGKVDNVMEDGEGKIARPEKDGEKLHTTLSYGLSISYYKYPLYEALATARELLFGTAKHVGGKNAVAWCLRKHSGSGFVGSFTKNTSKESVYQIFDELMKYQADEKLISAIAHKLRSNAGLLDILKDKGEERIKAFYRNMMEENDSDGGSYVETTRRLLCALLDAHKGQKNVKTEDILSKMYGMLRTAKFVNGEGDNDE